MPSKRFNKLPENTKKIPSESFEKLLPLVKQNCTTKFDESIDLNFQINNKQKKSEINIRTAVNLPGGTGKKVKVAVVCEENKSKDSSNLVVQFFLSSGNRFSIFSALKSLVFSGNFLYLLDGIILLPLYPLI
jgi:ribosomal protein L1